MRYLGGKHKIGEELSQFMVTSCSANSVDGYLEPFCGSLGVFKHMTDKGYKKYIASDIQPDLIEMWNDLKNGTLKVPDKMTEKGRVNILKYYIREDREGKHGNKIFFSVSYIKKFKKAFFYIYPPYPP